MKPTSNHASHRNLTDAARRLNLGRALEEAYGAGVMGTDTRQAPSRAGWTVAQLVAMSEAKSLYN
ncbi:hypothetical protein [Leptolyngbya iicbica]|uniref:Uncharacterized protein n=2 Tax=Cyanophyceae TaxID=3028117 RepID=A0A4Q7E7A9_9CYAN|nr:hypothetical protein [Leptolyngbya sp. LK]RZM76505.1 hypothetical protein DYY88_17705 [Leptolyngbya sp. LK]